MWINSPDDDAFSLFHQLPDTTDRNTRSLSEKVYDTLGDGVDTDIAEMDAWLSFFARKFRVFFSSPLDLDLAMLESFPDAYKGLAPPPKGPRMPAPADKAKYQSAVKQRVQQVLAADGASADDSLGSTYTDAQRELFPWYKYLFVDGSKPVAHMRALLAISDTALSSNAPRVLRRLVKRARRILSPREDS